MKTTVELPDELLLAAKKQAAELRTTLRDLIEAGLRQQLQTHRKPKAKARNVRFVVAKGGLPPGMDINNRAAMHGFLQRPL